MEDVKRCNFSDKKFNLDRSDGYRYSWYDIQSKNKFPLNVYMEEKVS